MYGLSGNIGAMTKFDRLHRKSNLPKRPIFATVAISLNKYA